MRKIYTLCFLLASAFGLTANAQIVGENMIENFENIRTITYDPQFTGGTLTGPIANPDARGANTSTQIGQYVRNAAIQYDVLVCNLPGNIVGINDYLIGTKKFSMKVWTNAPVGTDIELTVQNRAASTGGYPTGRHSVYRALTTATGTWMNLTFDFITQPAAGTAATSLDQIVVSFNNDSFTGDTYYFDDFAGTTTATPSVIRPEFLWTNFTSVNNLTVSGSDGVISTVVNPARSIMHNSDSVAQYVRSAVQYDVIRYTWGASALTDLAAYRANEKKFFIKVYSPAVGTTVQFTLQNATAALGGYPAGRFGEFTGATTVANAWETVRLNYANTPDGTVTPANVNELAILFNSGIAAPITVRLDSISGPVFTPASVKAKQANIQANLFPNPATSELTIQLPENGVVVNAVAIKSIAGQTLRSQNVSNSQLNTATVAVNGLTNGIYLCEITTNKGVTTKRFVVSK